MEAKESKNRQIKQKQKKLPDFTSTPALQLDKNLMLDFKKIKIKKSFLLELAEMLFISGDVWCLLYEMLNESLKSIFWFHI